MARNKAGRPEWFKFWRRNRRQLDIEQLSMESRGVVFTNVMRYFDDADEQNLLAMDALESMAFNVVRINVDDSFAEYAERSRTNRENGSKGGRPPETESNRNNPVGYIEAEETDAKRENPKKEGRCQTPDARRQMPEAGSGTDAAKPPRPAFSPPSLEEVRAYCQERGNSVDAQRFVDYYGANGWKVGKNPMKDWKAAVRTWENNDYDTPKKNPKYMSSRQQKPLSSDEWDKIMEAI